MKKDLTRQKFSRLMVLEFVGKKYGVQSYWKCLCDCGEVTYAVSAQLLGLKKFSCGCLNRELSSKRILERKQNGEQHTSYKHGHAFTKQHTKTYDSWFNMKHRCYYEKDVNYKNYGGRGITVCERWLDFKNFLEDMGEKPEGFTLDRINVNGNYGPSNCRWADGYTQAINKRPKKIMRQNALYIKTCSETSKDLAKKYDITVTMVNMIKSNKSWVDVEKIFTPNNNQQKYL